MCEGEIILSCPKCQLETAVVKTEAYKTKSGRYVVLKTHKCTNCPAEFYIETYERAVVDIF